MGYLQVGTIIAVQMDIIIEADTAITESEILYLANKLVKDNQLISRYEKNGSQCLSR